MTASIKQLGAQEIEDLVKKAGQPAFRMKQLREWLFVRWADSYDEMTNLPLAFREQLASEAPLTKPIALDRQVSRDGTRKYVLELSDGLCVETVAIPSKNDGRLTVCFSTQVGCAMACAFCATGHEGFTRNLGMGEIVDQVLFAQEDMGMRVSNLVAMGQGEPFLNYETLIDALHVLNDPKGIAIGARKITVSTCGILDGITRFAKEPEQFTLAISLHSAVQQTRDALMPRVANQPLDELKKTLTAYLARTNRRVTFEFLLIEGLNDSQDELDALLAFCDGLLCHVNLLPVNPVEGSPFQPSSRKTADAWIEACEAAGISATYRQSRGADIQGACGQLKNSRKD